MKVLNFFYEHHPKFEAKHERKVQLSLENTLIKGADFSGKTSLICNFLSSFKESEVLFIDMLDLRFDKQSLVNLKPFLEQNPQIKILCLCNVSENLELKVQIPTLISTNQKDLELPNFKNLWLDFYDFEEFISINKNLAITQLVGLFLQTGRSKLSQDQKLLRTNFSTLELEILKYLALNLGSEISIAKLLKSLQNTLKSSKDSVYKSVKDLENSFITQTILHDEKNLKKIYFRDFGLKNALCVQKDFKHLFENLILNELSKLNTMLYYNKFFSFYSKDLKIAYISSPTLDTDLIKLRIKKILPKAIELGIFHLVFITLSSEETFFEQGVKIEILSFSQWALSF